MKNSVFSSKKLIVILLSLFFFVCSSSALVGEPSGSSNHQSSFGRISPSLKEFHNLESGLTLKITCVLVQLAVVLIFAKLGGAVAERLHIPGVLGELGAGMLIGPFALGSILQIPIHGQWIPLFPEPLVDAVKGSVEWPVSDEFWFFAQLASIFLLFITGLHTNLKQFLKYMGPASLVAVGGVVLPFFFGAFLTALFSESVWHAKLFWYSPQSLFVGAVMVATSVGITARVLSDIKRLDTPEGVTILGAAVVDDVLGILVLSIVSALAGDNGKGFDVNHILWISVKAFGFWLGLTFIGLALANKIEWLFSKVKYPGARLGLTLGLVLLCSAVSEMFGLAFIIGAYSIGLALSKTKMAHTLMEELSPINDFVVPIFFAAMGMLVNFKALGYTAGFGLILCVLAIIGKIIGCGIPSLLAGFSMKGAIRIGIGMLPRGEVALIMAGVGLAGGYINSSIFGVAILMTLVTTVIAPLLLVPSFKWKGSGLRKAEPIKPEIVPLTYKVSLTPALARILVQTFLALAVKKGFELNLDEAEYGIALLTSDKGTRISVRMINETVEIQADSLDKDSFDRLISEAEHEIISVADKIYPNLPIKSNV
jgi:Kef-type K+ transport system membrane component KefB